MAKGIKLLLPSFAALGLLVLMAPGLTSTISLSLSGGLIVLYAFLVWGKVKYQTNRDSALHALETIYFLGFVNTLLALSVLFVRLGSGAINFESFDSVTPVFTYIGVAVVTSLAGLLLQNMSQAAYLELHPESQNQELKDAAEILQNITEKFADNYLQAFKSIQEFLDERKSNTLTLDAKEKQYIAGIERFLHGIDKLTGTLESSSQSISPAVDRWVEVLRGQGDLFQTMTESAQQMQQTVKDMSQAMGSLPFQPLHSDMEVMSRELQELGQVVDGMIELLDKKMKKLKV